MRHNSTFLIPRHQQGMVLIIALIILLVLTILGVSGMTTSSLQERMAQNAHDRQMAFQSAETALRAGESYIQSTIPNSNTVTTWINTTCNVLNHPGMCDCSSKAVNCPIYWSDPKLDVWGTNNPPTHVTVQTGISKLAAQPMYIIEFLGWVPTPGETSGKVGDPMMFRVTALGYGQSPNAKVMLQSTYKK